MKLFASITKTWMQGFALVVLLHPGQARAQSDLPPGAQAQISAGVRALRAGDLDASQKIFLEAERHGIRHALISHNLGIIAQQRGEHEKAISRFRDAIRLQPDYGPAHLLLGSSLLALRRNSEAVRELKRAAGLMPREPQAHLQLAKAYEGSENWIGAVQEFQKLVDLAPQEPEYSYQLGKAWMKLSGWSYEAMSKINPNSARLQQRLGQEYAIQEKYDSALAAYERAARADPKLPEIHLAMAVILLEQKKFDEAHSQIELELKLAPESKAAADVKSKIESAMANSQPGADPK